MPFTKSEHRKFTRIYFSGAVEVTLDKQGRILLASYLKDFAEIKRDIVLIGVSNRIEIWSKENWLNYYGSSRESYEQIAENIIGE
jgi:MraZ protein